MTLTGCVTKKSYDLLMDEKIALEQKLNEESQSRQQSDQENQLMSERSSLLEQQNVNLRNTNQILVQKNSTLSTQVVSIKDETLQAKKQIEERQKAIEYASQTYDDLVRSLKQEVEEGKVTIDEMKDQLRVGFVERIVFPAGTVEINDAGKKVLDKVAKILKGVKNKRIEVLGHCDNSAVAAALKQNYPTNWEVSARRATSVVRYLESKGVSSSLLAAVALSHYHPIADNKTPTGRQTNRRIEIVLTPLREVVPAANSLPAKK